MTVQLSEIAGDYRLASLCMADLIAAHDLDLREWLVLDFIRRQSFGAGRCEAEIESLNTFQVALDISKGNISAVLKRLKQCLAIEERPQFHYGFMFPVSNWKLPIRVRQVEVIKQLALFDGPPHIRDAMRENFVEQCQTKPGGSLGLARALVAPEPGVPESGTPAISPSRSRIGNDLQTPMRPGSLATVPDSGTGHAYMQQCSNVPEGPLKHASGIATCRSVPESGTARRPQLSQEEQRLFDQLRSVGAYGAARNDQSRACWFGMVKARPAIVEELLGDLKYAMETRPVDDRPKNPGAWMMDKWQRWGRPNDRG